MVNLQSYKPANLTGEAGMRLGDGFPVACGACRVPLALPVRLRFAVPGSQGGVKHGARVALVFPGRRGG